MPGPLLSLDAHSNLGYGRVAIAPLAGKGAAGGTTFTLEAGQGSLFPAAGEYNLQVFNPNTGPIFPNVEYVRVKVPRAGDKFTVVRFTNTENNNSEREIQVGDVVTLAPTAKLFGDIEALLLLTNKNTGITYVSVTGNDNNDGLTWATAKLTIPAAISALPEGLKEKRRLYLTTPMRQGVVEIGFGEFPVTSILRLDTAVKAEKAKSAIIEDANIKMTDLESYVIGPNIKPGTQILAVWEGAYGSVGAERKAIGSGGSGKFFFEMSTTTAEAAAMEVCISKSAFTIPSGVTIVGRGRQSGQLGGTSKNCGTKIFDNGNGVTIQGESGYGEKPEETWNRVGLEGVWVAGEGTYEPNAPGNLSVSKGQQGVAPKNIYGFTVACIFGARIAHCTFTGHGQFGIYLGNQSAVAGEINDIEFRENGQEILPQGGIWGTQKPHQFPDGTEVCGGIWTAPSPNQFNFINVRAVNNFGVGAKVCGVQSVGDTYSHNHYVYTTLAEAEKGRKNEAGKPIGESGKGIACEGTFNGSISITGLWCEGNDLCAVDVGSAVVSIDSALLQGDGKEKYAINVGNGGILDARSLTSFNHLEGCINEGSNNAIIRARGGECTDPMYVLGFTKARNIGTFAASGDIKIAGTKVVELQEFNFTLTNGSTKATGITTNEFKQLRTGALVSGASIPAGTVISELIEVSKGVYEVILSNKATATLTEKVKVSLAPISISTPPEPFKVTLVSGVAWHNVYGDVRITIPIEYTGAGEATLKQGIVEAAPTIFTAKGVAGLTHAPFGERTISHGSYVTVTTSGAAAILAATVQNV